MPKSSLLIKWLVKEKSIIFKIYLLSLVQGLMYLALPLGIQAIITYVMAGRFTASLVVLCSLTIIAIIFIGIFQIWSMRITETLHQRIIGTLTDRVNALVSAEGGSTEMLSTLNKYLEIVTLQKGISKILLDFSFSIISIFIGLLILPAYSFWFLIFTILLGLAFFFIIIYYGRKGIESNIRTSNEKYGLLETFQKNDLTALPLTEQTELRLTNYYAERNNYYHILENQLRGIIIIKIIFISILLFFGAYLVQSGDLTIGQFVASEIIIFLVINAVEKLVGSLNTFYDINTALYKIESMFKAHPELSFIGKRDEKLKSMRYVFNKPYSKALKIAFLLLFGCGFITLFLPWTQNIESAGKVTALNPENMPQTITSRIAGRIEKWYIHEGDYVKKNDTIAFISEIKDEYVDPLLIERSEQQIKAKETTLESYEKKINAVNQQIDALTSSLRLKTEQAKNKILQTKIKIATDSIEAEASLNNYKVAEAQLNRYEELLKKGVISRTDLENRKIKLQEALAKKNATENKFLVTKSELLNAEIELNSIRQEYQEKLMKAESDKFSSLSMLYEGEGALTKLQNQMANYNMRKNFYYVLSPQDGYIAKTYYRGIGEIVKEGASLCSVVPESQEQAVELYIDPVDLPLISRGQQVQLIFDGWPAFVFSGWPGVSYGTYSAEIVAFDKVVSDNGKFRLLAKRNGQPWPSAIQLGGGVKGFALMNDVPVIYELWRKINGFPPEFYQPKSKLASDGKKQLQ